MTKSIDEMIDNLIVKSEGAIKALKEIDTIQENLVVARAEIQKQIKICEENVKKYEEKKKCQVNGQALSEKQSIGRLYETEKTAIG